MGVVALFDQVLLRSDSLIFLKPLLKLFIIVKLLFEICLADSLVLDLDAFLEGLS